MFKLQVYRCTKIDKFEIFSQRDKQTFVIFGDPEKCRDKFWLGRVLSGDESLSGLARQRWAHSPDSLTTHTP